MANKSKQRGRSSKKAQRPAQKQTRQPGRQRVMRPEPKVISENYRGSGKRAGRAALISGGDSGIGRSVAVAFAREGADVAIAYLEEKEDAEETRRLVEAEGRACLPIRANLGRENACNRVVQRVVEKLGRLDILVNNSGEQYPVKDLSELDEAQLTHTFRTNVFSMFFLSRAALPHLRRRKGSCIINTTSVTAYRGSPGLLDYAATKGAIVSFTRSLSQSLVEDGIRVNAVAPGPIWTPLIPASFDKEKVKRFGGDTPMGRAGEPAECAGAYVFLASEDASYITGQVIHPNGGEIING